MRPSGNLICNKSGVKLMSGFGKWHVTTIGFYQRYETFEEAKIVFRAKVKETETEKPA